MGTHDIADHVADLAASAQGAADAAEQTQDAARGLATTSASLTRQLATFRY